ncbi:MAG: DNA-3-methyladenine glycosylase 1 [Candidatus Erwinia impunctatus]|nr:DNA-3-methyladenine glycosylase 1 [Culicoides impunctatus]
MKTRCGWVSADPIYQAYHDTEWGRPEKKAQPLFEMLCLEAQVAGLSWLTVLKKRHHYREVFHQFDPQTIAQMTEDDTERLLLDPGIIRHRGKIEAIIANARAFLAMEHAGEPFADFIWQFVQHTPQHHHYSNYRDAPTTSTVSDAMSRALKKRGFKFVGSTTCYSFMQACGLINDHEITCFCHPDNQIQRA